MRLPRRPGINSRVNAIPRRSIVDVQLNAPWLRQPAVPRLSKRSRPPCLWQTQAPCRLGPISMSTNASFHARQRFARVTVAEMQLAKPGECRAGREKADFYLFLNKEIDKAREIYRKQFMTISSMVDYLHLELVQTAVEGDERKLGADYPGQLV